MSEENSSTPENKKPAAVVNPSPFEAANNKRYNSEISVADATWQIYHVKPTEASFDGCIFIRLTGKVEGVAASTLFERTTTHAQTFLKLLKPLMRVVYMHEDGNKVLNSKGYGVKGLVFFQPKDVTEEQCKLFVTKTFLPALKNYNYDFHDPITEEMWPVEHPTESYIVKEVFTEVMNDKDYLFAVKQILCAANDCKNQQIYFQKTQAHVYSGWRVGNVPLHVITKFRLTKMHLHEDDFARVLANNFKPKAATATNTTTNNVTETTEAVDKGVAVAVTDQKDDVPSKKDDKATESVAPTDLGEHMAGEKKNSQVEDIVSSSDDEEPIAAKKKKKQRHDKTKKATKKN